jgi:hypothetical protein
MAAPAVAAGGTGTGTPASSGAGGQNPFWEVTNLFSQKNKLGVVTGLTLSGTTTSIGAPINAGNYIRGLRMQVRSTTQPTGSYTPPTGGGDLGFELFNALGIQNTDGAEILFDVINGFAYAMRQIYFRPWLKDPRVAFDALLMNSPSGTAAWATGVGPSFTLFLNPEVRQMLGCLENTDTRSQYTFTGTIGATGTGVGQIGSWATTQPTISVVPYTDMWAQPDAADLENVPNQRIPPGVNLQTKTRHQMFQMGTSGTDNNFLSTLTGNAIRGMVLITRGSSTSVNQRVDALTEPITWSQDSRNLGNLSPDMVFRWTEDMLDSWGYGGTYATVGNPAVFNPVLLNPNGQGRPAGVYPFLRFYDPGDLKGQGWLYTANSSALNWESVSSALVTAVGTTELVQEEVYAVGAVDPSLIDI